MYPDDVDPMSGCRLPLPRREELDDAGQRIYDSLADPKGGTIRGLRGPGGIMLHSPDLSRRARPVNRYLRHEAGLGGRVRELAILTTARELDSQFEWAAHEPEALAEGIPREIIDIIKHRKDTSGLDEVDAIVIELGREILATEILAKRNSPSRCVQWMLTRRERVSAFRS
jgi:4-carboxymuconolactone decarboxylase